MGSMNYDDYKNTVGYPESLHYECECGKVFLQREVKNVKYCSECGTLLSDLFNKITAEYDMAVKKYRTEEARLHEKFKTDLLDEYGLSDHPKKEKIYAYAWMKGHAYGFSEVASEMGELMDYGLFD